MTYATASGWPDGVAAADSTQARLEAAIERAFSGDPRHLARTRAWVLARYADRAPRPRRGPRVAPGRYSLAVVGIGLVLGVASVSIATATSGPNTPFYPLRLALETTTLPASGTARWRAAVARLTHRYAEARTAIEDGDRGALAAASDAYLAALGDVVAQIGQPGADAPALGSVLSRQAAGIAAATAGATEPLALLATAMTERLHDDAGLLGMYATSPATGDGDAP